MKLPEPPKVDASTCAIWNSMLTEQDRLEHFAELSNITARRYACLPLFQAQCQFPLQRASPVCISSSPFIRIGGSSPCWLQQMLPQGNLKRQRVLCETTFGSINAGFAMIGLQTRAWRSYMGIPFPSYAILHVATGKSWKGSLVENFYLVGIIR